MAGNPLNRKPKRDPIWVSGPPPTCLNPRCESLQITLLEEWFDGRELIFVGRVFCFDCGMTSGYSRRPHQQRPERRHSLFKPNTPLYLHGITPKTENVDGETRKRVLLEFFVQPFKPEMADDLNIKSHLYSAENADPFDDLVKTELSIKVPVQRMTIRMAPDAPESRMAIDNVKVSPTIKVRRDKEGPILAANFTVDFPYPSPDDLLFLFTNYLEQLFVTFERMQGQLDMQTTDEKPRRGRRKKDDDTQPALDEQPTEEPVAVN